MSLVKILQIELTTTFYLGFHLSINKFGRLINEIVWGGRKEELKRDGESMSHFEMYLQAMQEAWGKLDPCHGGVAL